MNLFAPVCPINVYEALKERGKLPKYVLLLAHDVLQRPQRYHECFADADCTIILDNSVIELGDACTPANLWVASTIVQSDFLAIPDVLCDGVGTIEALKHFIDFWVRHDDVFVKHKLKQPSLMFIPQGKDPADFSACLEAAAEYKEYIGMIGIPRNLVYRLHTTRQYFIREVTKLFPDTPIHLLGFSENLVDDIMMVRAWPSEIMGIDSAVPVRLATAGVKLSKELESLYDPGPRGTWWEDTCTTELASEVVDLIEYNIDQYTAYLK